MWSRQAGCIDIKRRSVGEDTEKEATRCDARECYKQINTHLELQHVTAVVTDLNTEYVNV